MKIGISTLGYNCNKLIDKVFEPWLKRDDVIISAGHGVFPEFAELGCPSHSPTVSWFQENLPSNAYFVSKDEPIREHELRNLTLKPLLDANVDFIWLLDARDEIYTTEQIDQIIEFVQQDKYIGWYKVNFKNLIKYKGEDYYYFGFNPPRIWNNKICGGVKEYYWDNDIVFNNGRRQNEVGYLTIPDIYVEHHSWNGDDNDIKQKIDFQKIHYKNCSFVWTDEGLDFNKEYYKSIPTPELFKI